MVSEVWSRIEQLAKDLQGKFAATSSFYSWHNFEGWGNDLYSGPTYRRAHVEIVDFRKTHNIYILHSTVFPHFNDSSPIWGFDAVCGPSKITGAFHDFSSGGNSDHPMMKWFAEETKKYGWNKPRELPHWAKQIFSPSMIAAGNIREGRELDDLCKIAQDSIDYYLENVGETQDWPTDYLMAQNRYCRYQKQNPHVINSMVAMGIPREQMQKFVDEVLFPETPAPAFV